MLCLLIVRMLNIFLVSSMGFNAYRMHIFKTRILFTSCAPSDFFPRSLENVYRKLLIPYQIQ